MDNPPAERESDMALQGGGKTHDDRLTAASPPLIRWRRRRRIRDDAGLGWHRIKPAYLFECVLRLCLVTLPRIVFRKYPAVPRLVSFGFMYLMLQLLGIHYAFLINAATTIALDVSGYAVARAFDATGFGVEETVAAVASAYTFYASLRLVTHFGSHIAAVAWGCVDDFPEVRQVVARAGARPFLLPVLFLPQLALAALLVAAPTACDPFNAEIASAGGGHPFSLGFDPVLAGARWRQGASEWSHRAAHFCCTRTPVMYLSRPYERPRQTLQLLLTISLLQYLQVLLQRYPSWRRDLRKAGLRQRLALHFGLLANATLTALWTLRWAAHCFGLDVLHWWPVADYMNAGLVLVLLWTAFLAILARCLSVAATSDGPDVDSLREYMAMVKASFLFGCCAVFCRGCLHPEMGFLMAQEEVTILTVAMPMLYVLTFMLLEACLGITRRLLLLAPALLAVATVICRVSRFGGPGTLLLVFLHLFRKAIEHFGATGNTAAATLAAVGGDGAGKNALAAAALGDRDPATTTAAEGGVSAESQEDGEGESVLMAAYREALSFLKAEAAAAAAEAAASGSEPGSNVSAADAFSIADAAEVLSIPDETAFCSSVDGDENVGVAQRDSEDEDTGGASAFDDISISLAAVGGGNSESDGGDGGSGADGGAGSSGGDGEGERQEAGSVRPQASGNLSVAMAAADGTRALDGPLGWDRCMVELAETEGVAALTERWRLAASSSKDTTASTSSARKGSAPEPESRASPVRPAAAAVAPGTPATAAASDPTTAAAAAASTPPALARPRTVHEPGDASPAARSSERISVAADPAVAAGVSGGAYVARDTIRTMSGLETPRREVVAAADTGAGSGPNRASPTPQRAPPLPVPRDNGGVARVAAAMIASASPAVARETAVAAALFPPALAASSSSSNGNREDRVSEEDGYVAPWWAFWDSRRHNGGGASAAGRRMQEEGKTAADADTTVPPSPTGHPSSPLRGAANNGTSGGDGHASNGPAAAAAAFRSGEAGDGGSGGGGSGGGGSSTALAIGSALLAAPQRGRESLNAALAALVARMEAAAAPNACAGRFAGSNGNGSGTGVDGLASPGWLRGVQQVYEETDTRFLYRSLVSVAALILLALGASVAVGGFLSHIQERVRFFPNFMAINSTAAGQVVISHAFASTAVLETKGPVKMEEPHYAACGARWHGLSLVDYALLAEMAYVELDRAGPERRDALVQMLFPREAGFDFELRLPTKEFNGGRPRASFFEAYSPSLNLSVISIRGTDLGRVGDFLEDWKTWVSPMVISCLSTLFPTIQIWPKETTAAVVLWMDETLEVFGVQPRPDYFRPLVQYVRGIGHEGSSGDEEASYTPRQVVLTGHSLGGGLARIVGALERKSSICFSPPGVAQSYRKFRVDGAMLDRRFLLHTSVSVIPENDLVTKIDSQVGLIQTIQCATSSKALQNSCHMLEGTLCDLVRHCGDDRGRFSDCNYIFDVGRAWPLLWDMMRGGWQLKDFFT